MNSRPARAGQRGTRGRLLPPLRTGNVAHFPPLALDCPAGRQARQPGRRGSNGNNSCTRPPQLAALNGSPGGVTNVLSNIVKHVDQLPKRPTAQA